MPKLLLDIGNCGADHGALTDLVKQHFDASITQVHGMDDAMRALANDSYDLITVNRIMDRDGSQGMDIIRAIKAHEVYRSTPVMLISNFENYQEQAIAAGAEPGFGKKQLGLDETVAKLKNYLA